MAINLDATPSSASANSYATVAEADAYVDLYILSETTRDAWADIEADQKSRLLIQATRQIDWYFRWQGYPTVSDQPLAWPRENVYRNDGYQLLASDEIPEEVLQATVEMALWLSEQGDSTPLTGNAQFDAIEVGPIKVNFNEKSHSASKIYLPDKVVSMLQSYGEASDPALPANNQIKVVTLVRG